MTDTQLYLAIGVPIIFNFGLMLTVFVLLNASMNARFSAISKQFDAMNQRFDDMRDLWRAELRRVEEVLDARLKHMEDERK